MIAGVRRWWDRVRLRRACNVIRHEAGRLGINLSHLSDADLVERAELAGQALRATRVTMEQAAEAFRLLGRAATAMNLAGAKLRDQLQDLERHEEPEP
jgi:hypothetical protein